MLSTKISYMVILLFLIAITNQNAFGQEVIKRDTIPAYYFVDEYLTITVEYVMYDSSKVEKRMYNYDNGELFRLETFKYVGDSLIHHGQTISNYPDGRLWSKSRYKNGKRSGKTYKYYLDNGQIEGISNFKNGVIDGKYFRFYPNGNVQIEGQFDKGWKSGVWKYYYENGYLQAIGEFARIRNESWTKDSIPFSYYSDTCKTSNYTPWYLKNGTIAPELKKGIWRFFDCKGRLIGTHDYYNENR